MEVDTHVLIRGLATETVGSAAELVLGGIRSFRKRLQEVGQYGSSGSLRRCLIPPPNPPQHLFTD